MSEKGTILYEVAKWKWNITTPKESYHQHNCYALSPYDFRGSFLMVTDDIILNSVVMLIRSASINSVSGATLIKTWARIIRFVVGFSSPGLFKMNLWAKSVARNELQSFLFAFHSSVFTSRTLHTHIHMHVRMKRFSWGERCLYCCRVFNCSVKSLKYTWVRVWMRWHLNIKNPPFRLFLDVQ